MKRLDGSPKAFAESNLDIPGQMKLCDVLVTNSFQTEVRLICLKQAVLSDAKPCLYTGGNGLFYGFAGRIISVPLMSLERMPMSLYGTNRLAS
jgi:hypothetical protein